jgi:hypothetical protein
MIDALRWQEIVYPSLLLLSVAMAGALLATYYLVDRAPIILALCAYFLAQSVAFFLLVLATGIDPIVDIDRFRSWIIYVRAAMMCILFVCLVLQMERVRRQ